MAKKKAATLVFDPELFGSILREERRKSGFSNTRDLSKAIEGKTGIFIDYDTLMKYERGEREPDVSKLMGIAMTVFGAEWEDGLLEMLREAIPEEATIGTLMAVIEAGSKKLKQSQDMDDFDKYMSLVTTTSNELSVTAAESQIILGTPMMKFWLMETGVIEANSSLSALIDERAKRNKEIMLKEAERSISAHYFEHYLELLTKPAQ